MARIRYGLADCSDMGAGYYARPPRRQVGGLASVQIARRCCQAYDARHLRMPRSADVSASENAGRANSRSAYFMSGAACLGIWMP